MEEDLKKLKTLVEALTHSGSNTLDADLFKEVKKICRSSQSYIPHVYDLVFKHLHKKNSQIRLLAFQICKELFNRSGLFRESVIKDLDSIINLTTDFGEGKKLPGPNSSAKCLKSLVISTLNEWKKDFGDVYKKLKIAVNYLEKCKRVNFDCLDVRSSEEQIVDNEQQRRQRAVNEEKIRKVLNEFQSNEYDIKTMITSLSNCLSLLLPPVEDFFVPECNLEDTNSVQIESSNSCDDTVKKKNPPENEEEEDYISAQRNNLREFGVPSDYSLTLQVNPNEKINIIRNNENSAVIENAKDCVRLINKRYLPMVKNWIRILCKCNDRDTSSIKKIIDLKETLDNIIKKYQLLIIDGKCSSSNDSDSDDDDFEEVKKEGYEDGVDLMEEIEAVKNSFSFKEANKVIDPPVKAAKSKDSELCEPSTSGESTSGPQDRKNKLLTVAPKLPFDIDLYHWEDEDLKPPTLISTKIDVDKFWGSSGSDDIHEIPNPEGLAALRTRVIEFSGKFEPVKWACRAPLPNGKLCPRKDRFKCPFHGKIVARDEMGRIQNKEDQESSSVGAGESTTSDWQDPSLIKDIEAATGINLEMPEKKGKRRRKKEITNLTHKKMKTSVGALRILENKKLPGLIDVVKKQNNAYTRLSKKIFNRSSAKRVASALNKIDRNKFRDKFGDQFNYF